MKNRIYFLLAALMLVFVTIFFTSCSERSVTKYVAIPELYKKGGKVTFECDEYKTVTKPFTKCDLTKGERDVLQKTGTKVNEVDAQGAKVTDAEFAAMLNAGAGVPSTTTTEVIPTQRHYFWSDPFSGTIWDFLWGFLLPLGLIALLAWAVWRFFSHRDHVAPVVSYQIPAGHQLMPIGTTAVPNGMMLVPVGTNIAAPGAYIIPANQAGIIRQVKIDEAPAEPNPPQNTL